MRAMCEYQAHINDVYDGDTITDNIDLRFRSGLRGAELRLRRIDPSVTQGIFLIFEKWCKRAIEASVFAL
jgi:hypothetical protein